jgi:NADP-dependent 3-hydroxy acid dehydrogenase YdfG
MGDMERWRGKAALITGASSGIGRTTARALSKAGMRVALMARRAERLIEIKNEIETAGMEALSLSTDLCDEAGILRAFDTVRDKWGGVDVLVNSAGIGRIAPLMSGGTEHFSRMLQVNVLALIIATREAVKDMQARGAAGHIVHISSLSGYRVQAGSGMYAATKFAVRALTEGLRQELRGAKSPIRVTSVSPADTESEFMAALYGGEREAQKHAPPYRKMDSQDIADAVLYILSTPPHVEVHDILLRPIDQPD